MVHLQKYSFERLFASTLLKKLISNFFHENRLLIVFMEYQNMKITSKLTA